MIYDSIVQYLGSRNFALVSTNVPDISILRNQAGPQTIFCVIVDNTRSHLYSSAHLSGISSQLNGSVLYIIITGDTDRDRHLAGIGLNVWFADASSETLIVYEDQPSDFYGLRSGIEYAAFYDGPKEKKKSRFLPFVTIILIAVNVISFIILSLSGNTQSTGFMAVYGANYAPFVFEDLEIWRLVTCMFMHFGLSHLVNNMIYLAVTGYYLEKRAGHLKFLLIYMLSGIGSSLVSAAYYYITGAPVLSAGASGAIYGIVGTISLLTFRDFRKERPAYLFWRIGILLLFIFYSSFLNRTVDGAAHIGGFIFGLILGLIFIKPNTSRRSSI